MKRRGFIILLVVVDYAGLFTGLTYRSEHWTMREAEGMFMFLAGAACVCLFIILVQIFGMVNDHLFKSRQNQEEMKRS